MTMALKRKGKDLKRKVNRVEGITRRSLLQAKNKVGTSQVTKVSGALSTFLNVPKRVLKTRHRIYRSTRFNPTFRAVWHRRAPQGGSIPIPLEQTKGLRVGKKAIVYKAYGKKQKDSNAFKIGARLYRRKKDGSRINRMRGVFIKAGYGPVRQVKRNLKPEVVKEFKRVLAYNLSKEKK